MRVLFFITVRGHGRGGHFHSLNHISKALGDLIEVGICSYGNGRSQIIEENTNFLTHIYFNGLNLLGLKKAWKKVLGQFKPTIVHFFDLDAYNIFSLVFNRNEYISVLNKCGGPNPRKFPFVQNLVLFSEEDGIWFRQNYKFRHSNIKIIPNRINPDIIKSSGQQPIKKENSFCFVRISRIGNKYRKSIEDSIRLIDRLSSSGFDVYLYIIGAVQDEDVLKNLECKVEGLPIRIITDNRLTHKASDLLYLADVVIATGRGVMEGSSLGKPVLTPARNSDIPLLITRENFRRFFQSNFSQRNEATLDDLDSNFYNIVKLIQDQSFYDDICLDSNSRFEKYFSTQTGAQRYLDFYNIAIKDNKIVTSWFTDLILKSKSLAQFILKNL